jgi:arylsulfatase A-like enzyme
VRFVQLYDWGWDMHGEAAHTDLAKAFTAKTNYMDKAVGALIADLRERGMLDDTLVVVGGEFGRTPMWENRGGAQNAFFGRDHHPAAFSMLVAGGGFRGGLTYGSTDEIGYEVVDGKMHVHDLQATLLHQLGLEHESLNYRFQGRDFRLTDTGGKVVRELIT